MMLWLKDCGYFAKWRNYNDNYGIYIFTCVRTNRVMILTWLCIPSNWSIGTVCWFRWGPLDFQRNAKCSKLWNQRITANGYTDGLILKATSMNFKWFTGITKWCVLHLTVTRSLMHTNTHPFPHTHTSPLKCVQCACFWVAEFVC